MMNPKCSSKKEWMSILFWLAAASGFVFLFSYSTSPLYPAYYGGDSAQFQTIGKSWLKGAVPYKDLFDHKGPWIFFINMLGYLLGGTKYGICCIQMIGMWSSLCLLFKTARYCLSRAAYAFGTVFLAMFFLFLNYGEGNLTEEYCLPFICASVYYIYIYFNEEHHQHSPKAAFLYGVTFCVCFYARVTNCVLVAAGVLAIAISWLSGVSKFMAECAGLSWRCTGCFPPLCHIFCSTGSTMGYVIWDVFL